MQAIACAALLLFGAAGYAMSSVQGVQPKEPFAGVLDEHPVIGYASRTTRDRVATLMSAVAAGRATLTHREPGGYLLALLDALEISPDSQLLVHSKTGIQRAQTSPENPRALYFNDSVVVGYIPGARYIEIAAHDPEQGVIFYVVDQFVTSFAEVTRRTNCLSCHVSGATLEVPGLIVRSQFTNSEGEVLPQLGFHITNHRSPLPRRWGGWFVTGNYVAPPYGGIGHMGNVFTALHPTSGPAGTSNEIFIRWINGTTSADRYPSRESDIAALMVFDHQAHAINLLTRLNWEARVAASNGGADVTKGLLHDLVRELVDYFLFVDEAPPPARLIPRPGFVKAFTSAGRTDRRGRSLRELDLESRLLRYRCSYMIQSEAFEHLPEAVRQAVYRRLIAQLADDSNGAVILEVLRDTKPDFPIS